MNKTKTEQLRTLLAEATPGPWDILDKTTILMGPGDYIESSGRRLWDLKWRCWAQVSAHEYLTKCEMPWVQFDPERTNEKDAAAIVFLRNNAHVLLELVEAAEKAEKLFMAINDGFYTGLVPPEFAPVSAALRKWNGG